MANRRWNQDAHTQRAQREGYVARSAYKLLEIQEKHRVLARGGRVLDLGCAPGAWLQVASACVGGGGSVVGLDLRVLRHDFGPSVRAVQGDAFNAAPGELLGSACELFSTVLSDMAPSTTGSPSSDHFASIELCDRALVLVSDVLKPGGVFVCKVFEGESYPDFLGRVRGLFVRVKGFKPKASRDASREMFVVAHGFCPGA